MKWFFELSKTTKLKEIAWSAILGKALPVPETHYDVITSDAVKFVMMGIRDKLHARQRVLEEELER